MSWAIAGLGLVVGAAAAAVDYCHARYVRALVRARRHAAARWSLAQWGASVLGLVLVIRVSLWLLPFEGVGLYLGTWLGSDVGNSRPPPTVGQA